MPNRARPRKDAGPLADRLHSVAVHLLRRLRKEDDASGLSAPRLSALSVVVFGGPITLGKLAAAEQVRPPTMTRLVQALERDGLLARATDAGDARIVRVRATAKGRRLLMAGRARRVHLLASELAGLPAAERETIATAVSTLEQMLWEWRTPASTR